MTQHHQHTELEHDALHCPICSHDRKMLESMAISAAIQQRMLTLLQESWGVPKGDVLHWEKANPAANTAYASQPTAAEGVLRCLIVSGPGNIQISINSQHALSGPTVFFNHTLNGTTLSPSNFRLRVPRNSTFNVQTDSTAGTGLIAVTMYIEPAHGAATENLYMRQ